MDYREKTFKKKFCDASKKLGVQPEQVVSLKFRGDCVQHEEYKAFFDVLEREAGVPCFPIDGNLQGNAYQFGDDHTKIILVEHETGLEILYISGSIASLIGLVPLVVQGWRSIRSHFSGRHGHDGHVEIRKLDKDGHLREDLAHEFYDTPHVSLFPFHTVIYSTAKMVESEIHELRKEICSLSSRVETLEQQLSPVTKEETKPAKSKRTKTST